MKKYLLLIFLFSLSLNLFSQVGLKTVGLEFDNEPYTNIHPFVKGSLFFSKNISKHLSISTGFSYR